MKKILFLLGILLAGAYFSPIAAQAPKRWASGDIHLAIQKLNVLGSVLYVAAHPDDENTQMIAFLSNDLKVNITYLSLTRGDGGQNLIGTEMEELLGVIRTQELLAARRIDGGKQLFSRAIDFGFSKHPDETLAIWDRDAVSADLVWAIRKVQPDIIINRFDHETAGSTHGHHTSSAILSYELFEKAADPTVYPEQLTYVKPWQARRLYQNTSWWFYGSRENFEKADKSNMTSVDVGGYYPILGRSNTEIAAESRSQHKCQGMGNTPTRGAEQEYLNLLKGTPPSDRENIFDGIDLTWNRVKGGALIGQLLAQVEAAFDYEAPAASVPALLEAYQLIQKLPDGHWKAVKTKEIKTIIRACLALFVEATADDYSATPGEEIELTMEVINRSTVPVELRSVRYLPNGIDSTLQLALPNNQAFKFYQRLFIPTETPYTDPYWLKAPWQLGTYQVSDQTLRGLPETPRPLKVRFDLLVNDVPISWEEEVVYKRTDPVDGEVYRPFEVLPPVFAAIEEPVYVFANQAAVPVRVRVKSGKADLQGTVKLEVPEGWKYEPAAIDLSLPLKGADYLAEFQLYPPEQQSEGNIQALVTTEEGDFRQELILIDYDHIPVQSVLRPAQSRVVKIDLKRAGERVAYIMGAGDEIPASLEQIGYQVDLLEERDITATNLQKYDALILGVRAYNTVDRLKYLQPTLFEYVEKGGTMIVQYNTTWRLAVPSDEIAPYPLKLSRDRVASETAEVRFLLPEHEVLNYPNKITAHDFTGWVQERGLYFPDEWDTEHFEAVLSSNDPGETPKDGGLLIAKYGKGYYIYTGYAWFRELPAGVAGAYRLFTNLISIGKDPKP